MLRLEGLDDDGSTPRVVTSRSSLDNNYDRLQTDNNHNSDDGDDHDVAVCGDENPLLSSHTSTAGEDDILHNRKVLSPDLARKLYLSHWLSTWNSRTYEFAVVSVVLDVLLHVNGSIQSNIANNNPVESWEIC